MRNKLIKTVEEIVRSNWWARKRTAVNPNTPVEVLKALAKDKDPFIKLAIIENPMASAEVLSILAKDKNLSVRVAVVCHPTTPLQILLELSTDKIPLVREAVRQVLQEKDLDDVHMLEHAMEIQSIM